jgi:hypothetical protein
MKKEQISHRLEKSIDLDPLFEETGKDNMRYVLLGEASLLSSTVGVQKLQNV